MISSLLPALQLARGAYGPTMSNQECVALLNRVAWDHKADGWGLSKKPNGNHGTLTDGTPVAIDVLYHQPSRTVWDVLRASGAESTPTWNSIKTYDFNGRPWVAPIAPVSAPGPSPTPIPNPPPPGPDYGDLIDDLIRRYNDLQASVTLLAQRVALLERREPPYQTILDTVINELEGAEISTSRGYGPVPHAHITRGMRLQRRPL